MKKRTQEELNLIFSSWEMRDGVLVWKRQAKGGKKKGDAVGLSQLKSGHQNCFLTLKNKITGYSVGQVAWFLYYGEWPTLEVDHIDCDPKNNKKDNLRLATRSEQCRNRKAGKSGRQNKGVYKRDYGDKWTAQIWVNGKCTTIGTFNSEEEAVQARIKASHQLHKSFANTQSYSERAA